MKHLSQYETKDFGRKFGVGMLSAALAASLMVPGLAFAEPSSDELQAQADAAQQRADSMGNPDDLQQQAQSALEKLNGMQETLDRTSAEYGEAIQAQLNAENNRDAAAAREQELQEEIVEVQGDLSTRARSMYRTGTSTMIDFLLGAESFEELATNFGILTRMNDNDAALIEHEKDLKAQAQEQREIYAQEATVAEAKAEEAAAAKAEAEATAAAYENEYNSLSAQAQEALEAEREAQELAAAAEAQRVVEEAARRAAEEEARRAAEEQAAREAEEAAARAAEEAAAQEAAVAEDSGTVEEAAPQSAYTAENTAAATASYSGGSATVDRAYGALGLPYVWGATGPGSFDCSGLVGYCLTGSYSRIGTTYTYMGWPQVSNPQPGDICTNWGHCGIYIGNGQMIHAPQTGDVVKIGPVQSGMIIVRYPG